MKGGAVGGRQGGQSWDENGLGHLWLCPASPNQPPFNLHRCIYQDVSLTETFIFSSLRLPSFVPFLTIHSSSSEA